MSVDWNKSLSFCDSDDLQSETFFTILPLFLKKRKNRNNKSLNTIGVR